MTELKERSDASDFERDQKMEILNNRAQVVFGKDYDELDGHKRKYIQYVMKPEDHGIEENLHEAAGGMIEVTNDIWYNQESGEFHTFVDDEPLTKEDVFVAAKGETYEYIPEEEAYFVQQPMKDTASESKFDINDLMEFEQWTKQL